MNSTYKVIIFTIKTTQNEDTVIHEKIYDLWHLTFFETSKNSAVIC